MSSFITVFGLAMLGYIELFAWTIDSSVGDSMVGLDGSEGIIAHLCRCICYCIEKRRFPSRWFADACDLTEDGRGW